MSKEELEFEEVFDKYLAQEKLYHMEGRKGVENLCLLSRALGYKDPMYFGQFSSKGSYGDFITFLEDNPGALEAIADWIRDQNLPEWKQKLESELIEEEEEIGS